MLVFKKKGCLKKIWQVEGVKFDVTSAKSLFRGVILKKAITCLGGIFETCVHELHACAYVYTNISECFPPPEYVPVLFHL